MKKSKVHTQMLFIWVVLIAVIITVPFAKNSYAQDNNWKQRLAEAEFEFKQIQYKTDVMYDMLKALYVKQFGNKAYEDLVFNAHNTEKGEK